MKYIKKFEKYDSDFYNELKKLIASLFYKYEYENMHVWSPKPVFNNFIWFSEK